MPGITLVGLLFLYLFPWILAVGLRHRNAGPIFFINLLLGWTFIGWVAALVMATWRDRF